MCGEGTSNSRYLLLYLYALHYVSTYSMQSGVGYNTRERFGELEALKGRGWEHHRNPDHVNCLGPCEPEPGQHLPVTSVCCFEVPTQLSSYLPLYPMMGGVAELTIKGLCYFLLFFVDTCRCKMEKWAFGLAFPPASYHPMSSLWWHWGETAI